MRRRRWEWNDPEPDDRPNLADDLGHFWIYDKDGDDPDDVYLPEDRQRNTPPGWLSPLLTGGGTCTWADIFMAHGAQTVTEISDEELEQAEADLLGFHAHYPGYEDPVPAPTYCTRCLGSGTTPWPDQAACPKCLGNE